MLHIPNEETVFNDCPWPSWHPVAHRGESALPKEGQGISLAAKQPKQPTTDGIFCR